MKKDLEEEIKNKMLDTVKEFNPKGTLSTGEMIDTLKAGEIAKTVNRIKEERVCRDSNGFYWCDSFGNPFTYDALKINDIVASLRWEIE